MKQNLPSGCSKSIIRQLLKDPLGLISLCIIGLFVLLALGAYLISPDSTPYANEQHLDIAVKKPGFQIEMLHIPKPVTEKTNLVEQLLPIPPHLFTADGQTATHLTSKPTQEIHPTQETPSALQPTLSSKSPNVPTFSAQTDTAETCFPNS